MSSKRFYSRTEISMSIQDHDGSLVRIGTMVREVSLDMERISTMPGNEFIHKAMEDGSRDQEWCDDSNRLSEMDSVNLVFGVVKS